MTIEKERELQAKIDAARARMRAKITSEGEEEEVSEIPDEDEDIPIMPETDKLPDILLTEAVFCNFCDSQGPRHKKVCTRDQQPSL